MNTAINILREIGLVTGDMAPYLLFGFGIAGVLHIFTSESWLQRHLGGPGFKPVLKSVLLGVPLPLCSCGVIGVSASLRKQGASPAAVTGFLIATPQTGVDSILATWGMLGPVLGVFRPLVAFITGLVGGAVVALLDKTSSSEHQERTETNTECCSAGNKSKITFGEALRYGFVTLPRDIAKPLAVGIVLSGLMGALLPKGILAPYIGGGLSAMIVMVAIGIPLYVCATASIPLAVGFIHLGATAGTALAFLIAGPATNAATIATVWKTLGRRPTFIYVGAVAIGGILSGLLFDTLAQQFMTDISGFTQAHAHHTAEAGDTNFFAAFLLLMVLANSLYGNKARRYLFGASDGTMPTGEGKNSIELTISGMRCENCARTVSKELETLSGVEAVTVNLENGKARIIGKLDDPEPLLQTVKKLGYQVTLSG